ncbi:DUF397 domain-containing protein [Actinokineospora enzanensis]|uniref:DUF397 domain-containing protein n=1 Tax=Actinokineospora enzanensis TaxID=155975 RepID=UPI00036303F8|nr:DUF397 domain-containing protein [Actinokineospora enzanensis]
MSTVATVWRKSTRSDTVLNCVELTWTVRGLAVRDSKNPGQIMDISARSVSGFLAFAAAGGRARPAD